ncbi:hypothetical protein BFW01_g460 [Lasiodiplodia theobromae]|nr:hypothetical protein BFW01_g460 [Lasiodiplodia theobromae]
MYPFFSLPKYSLLASPDEAITSDQHSAARASRTSKIVTVITLILLSLAATFLFLLALCIILITILPRLLARSSLEAFYPVGFGSSKLVQGLASYKAGTAQPCGSSPAEAKAAGCVFDLMTVSWLPLDCYDSELTARFMDEWPWKFYLSNSTLPEAPPESREQIPSLEAISTTTELMWTDRRFHIYHCIYGWKMMHRAVERGWKMESSLTSYHHTEHCSDTLANTTVPMDTIVTRVEISYPAC